VKYAFHLEAKAEFLAAIDYYEDRELGLGSDFAIEAHSIIDGQARLHAQDARVRRTGSSTALA
jgi:hypothetical protein